MSATIRSMRPSVARKQHQCRICGTKILKGEKQMTYTGVESGEGIYTLHLHPECEEYSRTWDEDEWESSTPGDITRNEVRRHVNATRQQQGKTPEFVTCMICGKQCVVATAHLHRGEWIGDECCWDERLRSTE